MQKRPSLDEITESMQCIFAPKDANPWNEINIDVDERSASEVRIRVSKMYELVPFTFGMMKQISDELGTEHLDFDTDAEAGCESCDYGSSYTHIITARWE